MKKGYILSIIFVLFASLVLAQAKPKNNDFSVKGFHLDLRIQVMKMPALKQFAKKLSDNGINTLVMEWEATYPFKDHPMIANRFAYTREEVVDFVNYCKSINIDVIPLQQSFGHVEYILRNYRYKNQREDQKDYSQVDPLQEDLNRALFKDLYTDLISTHSSKYIHIGGDETYLLGHSEKSKKKAQELGKGRLYGDYIKLLCDLVVSLGKTPVLWADIAIKYPDALKYLPKQTIFIDWNYGWDTNMFGDHSKLLESGFEIWGSPSIRSHPDNYFLTQWEKHFKNIKDFIPTARNFGYKGMVITSWSTSGLYSPVFETTRDIVDLYAIRRVYPITGFNILIDAYFEALKTKEPLNAVQFVRNYTLKNYGFDEAQSNTFWKALTTAPYEVTQGVVSNKNVSINLLLDSAKLAAKQFDQLKPLKNQEEFEHYRLMADIRVQYLTYMALEIEVNSVDFKESRIPEMIKQLKQIDTAKLDKRFIALNKNALYDAEIEQENQLRNAKIKLLIQRLSRSKNND